MKDMYYPGTGNFASVNGELVRIGEGSTFSSGERKYIRSQRQKLEKLIAMNHLPGINWNARPRYYNPKIRKN
ncbi:hypothetical protein HN832_03050 [archaeon]|jgi:hypothetical protein|nr:hypothetical protein [archaeon]MBT4373332.1 hypothetical protein [archaeon]MBT4531677.1 hypothetical protein [archaeon]MBT7001145.1 hypothetical protein [archaeon]MBT7282369.1 hypothetical protein [archaeon]